MSDTWTEQELRGIPKPPSCRFVGTVTGAHAGWVTLREEDHHTPRQPTGY